VTRELAVIETAAIDVPALEARALCEFYEGSELNADTTNWWAPNAQALCALCRTAGSSEAEMISTVPSEHGQPLTRGRLVAHAMH
jgi:hypothetical protein